MPIPPPLPQPYIKKSRVEYHGISVGDDFANKNECMYTIGVKSLREAFQYAVIKSCPQRYSVKCAQPDCKWNVYTHADGRFEMLYVGFGFAIRSFLRYMRPLIIIDGAHLKGNYLGTNLLAVGMDGNNQVIPLATGVSQGETGESWTWFLTKLKEKIGEPPNLCIISDRHAAIIQACGTVFDNLFHGFYDRHLMMNCNLKGKKQRGILWKACKADTTKDFDKAISELRVHRPKAVRKLGEAEAPENELCDWAAAKVYDRICRKWQLSGLPYGHVCDVCRVSGLTNCNLWAKPWFKKTTLKTTYQEMVYPLKDSKMWQAPNDLQLVLPPVMIKRPAGRPKNKDRILSTNEASTVALCTRCGIKGHNRNGCNQPFPTKIRRKSVRTNSLLQTPTWEEHLSEEARKDEERLRNGRVYMDWYDVEASQEPVTTEGMGVEDWQAVQGRLDSYNPFINFLSQAENDNYYQSQPQSSIQSNNQQSQPESAINYHLFHLDDM
ncbi:transposase, MuDR, MULE transposase domain protein [Tanacetum coccineum]